MHLALAPNIRAIWDKSWTTPWLLPALVAYDIALGLVLILGGADRITGPSFEAIRDAGGHLVVGSVVLTAGLLIGAAVFIGRRFMFVVSCAAAVVLLLIASGFLTSVLTEQPPPPGPPPACSPLQPDSCRAPRAALTGIPTYLVIAYWHLASAMLYGSRGPLGPIRRSRRPEGAAADHAATRPDTDVTPANISGSAP